MNTKKYIGAIMGLSMAGIMAMALPAFAATDTTTNPQVGRHGGFGGQTKMDQMQGQSGIFGTVSAINGNTITVAATKGFSLNSPATTTYTVDAANATVTKNDAAGTVASIIVGDSVSVKGTISGNTMTATSIRDGQMMNRGQGIFGTIATVNGNTLTVTGKQGFQNADSTTFTVDATNAKITKNNAAATVSGILVGDTVTIQGTMSGSNVTATTIWDGVTPGRGQGKGIEKPQTAPSPAITGNGQPVVAGTISTISDNLITITNKSNVTYTVNATNAKITQGQNTIQVSGLKTGDSVVVQGTVNGQTVTASSIIDQTRLAGSTTTTGSAQVHSGFMGSIGQFFMHLFGF